MTFSVEPLGDHDLEGFDCGNEELSDWLKQHAANATKQGTRTYVLIAEETSSVVGYFSIAPHLLERDEAPKKIGRGAPKRIPAVLLAKFAIDRTEQSKGLGSEFLIRALERIVEAARTGGGKVLVVDAIDDAAASFYEHHDFEPIPENPRRLVRKLSSVAAALDLPWP